MFHNPCPNIRRNVSVLTALIAASATVGAQQQSPSRFHLQEASIADIQRAIMAKKITSVELVELYLKRIKTYNHTCVAEPQGILGPITTIPHAKQVNALSTLNLAYFHGALGRLSQGTARPPCETDSRRLTPSGKSSIATHRSQGESMLPPPPVLPAEG
jgi:hypothetical protein